jgi:hypothetical protein
MNFGEIRVLRFERAQCGAKAIPTDLWIDASAKLFVVDEEMPVIIDSFGAHGSYREILLSAVMVLKPASNCPDCPDCPNCPQLSNYPRPSLLSECPVGQPTRSQGHSSSSSPIFNLRWTSIFGEASALGNVADRHSLLSKRLKRIEIVTRFDRADGPLIAE